MHNSHSKIVSKIVFAVSGIHGQKSVYDRKNLEPVRSSGLMVRGSLVLGELTLRKSSYQIEGYPVVDPRIPSYQLVELYFSKNFVAYSIIGSI